jgi:hypothetical protein
VTAGVCRSFEGTVRRFLKKKRVDSPGGDSRRSVELTAADFAAEPGLVDVGEGIIVKYAGFGERRET